MFRKYLFLLGITFVFSSTSLTTSALAQTQNTIPLEVDDDFDVDEDWDVYEEPREIGDPFLGYNQFMFKVNDQIYRKVFNPITKVYDFFIPKRIQLGIDNIFENLQMPKRMLNSVFQGKFKSAATETGRFVINSTVGIAGFFDPATSQLNWSAQNEDFSQTLGHYGVGSGPYLILPLLGPTSGRGLVGLVGDRALNPFTWASVYDFEPEELFDNASYLRRVNNYAYKTRDTYLKLIENSLDSYSALRNFYIQNQEQKIRE